MKTIWTPQPKQEAFQARWEYEALYGGAAGGGKSDALLTEALRQVHIGYYRGIVFRKTYPELTALIDRSMEIYKRAFPKARYNDNKHVWTFPSGAKVYFGAMQHRKDRIKYQGKQYDFVAFDELTHFTWEEYSYMFSRNRANGPGLRAYIRASTNPGGTGHGWVKDRFIAIAPPMTTIWEEVEVPEKDGGSHIERRSRIFVPANVFDNQILIDNTPGYIGSLASMPDAEKQALLFGNWDSFDGQVFREWKNDSQHYQDQRWTHVIEPFTIPGHWRVYRGLDWGYSKPFSVGWYAVDEDGRIYRIKEYYGCNGTPDVGLQMEATELGQKIWEIEHEDPQLKGRRVYGIADPAIFAKNGGQSIAQLMEKAHVYFNKGDHERIAGKMQYHYRFAFDGDGRPMFYVFKTCKNFIRTIPSLVYDLANVEDVNTKQEDHIYDECRYVLMDSPIAARKRYEPPKPRGDDPLDLHKDSNDPVTFYRF